MLDRVVESEIRVQEGEYERGQNFGTDLSGGEGGQRTTGEGFGRQEGRRKGRVGGEEE